MSDMAEKKVTPDKQAQGARLEQLRIALGYKTKTDFAKFLKVGEDTYRHYAEGRVGIQLDILMFLKRKHGVPSDWLLDGDDRLLPKWIYDKLYPRDTG